MRSEVNHTPYYLYNTALLDRTLAELRDAIADPRYRVHYAVKANNLTGILRLIARSSLGADCVSIGEVMTALSEGFRPEDVFFAGVGKTDREITLALKLGIGCLNVESLEELEVLNNIAKRMGVKAPVALRINPGIDAHTHRYITTGKAENKFGIPIEWIDRAIDLALSLDGIRLLGLHFHIGSQITDMQPFVGLCDTINRLQDQLESRNVSLSIIDVGGGLGVDYNDPKAHPIPDFRGYFDTFHRHLKLRPHQRLHFELGRSIVAQCGSLITRVLYVKQGLNKKSVIVDAGMTDLIRPALYGARHHIDNLSAKDGAPTEIYDVVGPVCESSDTFATDIPLPLTHRGDVLAIRSAGAYGQVMASQYNSRPLPQAVFTEQFE